mgnify:CR=1 FL=1
MVALDDRHLLVLNRRLTLQDLFTATIAMIELPENPAPNTELRARTLARLAPQGQTLMVDKDFMAVEYANRKDLFDNNQRLAMISQLANKYFFFMKNKRSYIRFT